MSDAYETVGIIGGSGMLGRAISTAVVRRNAVAANSFLISTRTGTPVQVGRHQISAMTDNQALADASDVIILCVPPAQARNINIHAPDKLIISVMAGIDVRQLMTLTQSSRIIRGCSWPE